MLNPNPRDDAAYERAVQSIRETVPGLVYSLWSAGASQSAIEDELLDAARAMLLREARAHTEETRAVG